MELYQIRYFLAVCEMLNFTRAAERCHVTQPSLTRAIQNLEHELGGQLFNRGRAGTALTSLGAAVRQDLAQAQGHVKAARAAAAGWTKGTKGLLRFGVSAVAGPLGIARFLGAFQRSLEGVTLTVAEGPRDDLLLRVERSELDAALVAIPRDSAPSPPVHCLYEERFVVVVPTYHKLAELDPIPVARLAGERLLVSLDGDQSSIVLSTLQAAAIDADVTCQAARLDCLVAMVAAGAGVAIVPEGLALPPSLTARALSSPARSQTIYLHAGKNSSANAMIAKLSDFADEYSRARSLEPLTRVAV